jgi:integrase
MHKYPIFPYHVVVAKALPSKDLPRNFFNTRNRTMASRKPLTTDTQCRATSCAPGQSVTKHSAGNGLALWAFPDGRRSWRLRYHFGGREKLLTFGDYPDVSLSEARKLADAARDQVKKAGIDPTQQRKIDKMEAETRQGTTFEAVFEEWATKKATDGNWTEGTCRVVRSGFRLHLLPHLGPRPISAISTQDLMLVFKKVEATGQTYQSNKLLSLTRSLFNYAIRTGRCTTSPAAPMAPNETIRAHRGEHMVAIPMDQLPAFLRDLRDPATPISPLTRYAIELQLLTLTRPGETRQAEWADIDIENKTWRIRAEHMKMKQPHDVPLSSQAIELLEKIGRISGGRRSLFPKNGKPTECMTDNTAARAIRIGMKYAGTAHGLRAIGSTILNESGLFRPDVIETALAHREKDTSRKPYNRALYWKERTSMLQWWADHLDALRAGAKVLEFKRTA